MEAVEFATLGWVDWFNNRRLLEPIGGVAVPGRCYCAHHLWIARGQGSASKRSVLSSHHAA
jgi:hypothetical protein